MATLRRDDEPVAQPRTDVQAPPAFLVGALAEVWAEHGHPRDLGGASGRYQVALGAWKRAEGLTTGQVYEAVAVRRSPWSLATWDAEGRAAAADARLAGAGVTRTDLPVLRAAALACTPTTRRTAT